MAVVRPPAATPPNRTLMPIVRKAMLIAMPLTRSRETIGVKRKNSTSNVQIARMMTIAAAEAAAAAKKD